MPWDDGNTSTLWRPSYMIGLLKQFFRQVKWCTSRTARGNSPFMNWIRCPLLCLGFGMDYEGSLCESAAVRTVTVSSFSLAFAQTTI